MDAQIREFTYQFAKSGTIVLITMLNAKQVRLNNLETLIAEAGSATALARLASTNSSYLSQVRHQTLTQRGTPRAIGDSLARKLESAMHKSHGWLDTPHITDNDMHTEHDTLRQNFPAHPLLPLLGWSQVSAGLPDADGQGLVGKNVFSAPVRCSADSFVLRVRGCSMEPRFKEDDLIFVDPNAPTAHGKYVIVTMERSGEARLRQLAIEGGERYLMALNPDWPERIVRMGDHDTIHGVVIFKGETV